MYGSTDTVSLRSVYPTAPGNSLGVDGSVATPPINGTSPKATAAAANSEVAQAAAVGLQGNPLLWLGVLAVMLIGLMWVAQRFGSEGATFANLKLSFYNVVIIALAAVVGINVLKIVFSRLKVPGLSAAILAV